MNNNNINNNINNNDPLNIFDNKKDISNTINGENSYIVIGLSNLGDKEYQSYFNNINNLSYNLHQEYWKYKMELCNNIKQY